MRVSTQNNADADPLWDSLDAVSGKNYCATGPLPDNTTYYAFARLANASGYGPWSAGRQFAVNTTSTVPNIVQVAGDSLVDKNGPFLGLGATYFSGLRFYHNWKANGSTADGDKLNGELALLRDGDFKYIRILTMVSWAGMEIAPVSFTNPANGQYIAGWPNYWNEFQGFLDLVASYGLRTEITIFAGAQDCMPSTATRQQHVATLLQKIVGHEHQIIQIEMANESWANGFSEPPVELTGYANTVRAGTTLAAPLLPISLSCPSDRSDASIVAFYGLCPAANIATVHFDRSSNEDGWYSVRDCYRTGLAGAPPVSSNEPVGPGSSVYDERDPIRLVMAAAFAWGANLPMYVWHTRAGVYGQDEKPGCSTLPTTCKLGDEAAIHDFVHLNEILPPDFSSWVRNDGREASAPFTTYCMGQANKWWPEVSGATNGVVP